MTSRITRRELLFREAPKGVIALAAGSTIFGRIGEVLAEPRAKRIIYSNDFMVYLKAVFWKDYLEIMKDKYKEFCTKHGLNEKHEETRKRYAIIGFFHELIKKDGVLENKYFLVEERKGKIERMVNGKLSPLGEDEKGRGPATMLRDLSSDQPRYKTTDGEKIFCFGDCDEFEMLYVSILKSVGIDAHIVMSAPTHVVTVVKIAGENIIVDNTHDIFAEERVCEEKCQDHLVGPKGYKNAKDAKAYMEHINKRAKEDVEVAFSFKGASRVEKKTEQVFERKKSTKLIKQDER